MRGSGEARRLDVRGLGYAVRIAGRPVTARATVALLHGFAGSSEDWADVAGVLADSGFASIRIDLPGHGATDVPTDPRRFTMAETVRDLAEIPASLGIRTAHWLGYSMGGRVALHLAITEPEKAASLILESASPGIEGERERGDRMERDGSLAAEIESRGIDWFVEHWESLPAFASQGRLAAPIQATQRARRRRNAPAGLAGSLRGLGQGAQESLGPRLGAIRCPTLCLAGALDSLYAAHAREMASAIPGAEHLVFPGAGHNFHLEQPEAFQRVLLDRLRGLESRSRSQASASA